MESPLPFASQAAEAVAAGRMRFSCQNCTIRGGAPIVFSLRIEPSEAVLIVNFRNEYPSLSICITIRTNHETARCHRFFGRLGTKRALDWQLYALVQSQIAFGIHAQRVRASQPKG